MPEIQEILKVCVQHGASDVLLVPGEPPVARLSGGLRKLTSVPPADVNECRRWIYSLLNDTQRATFEAKHDLDCAFALPGVGRFRLNVFMQNNGISAALRVITTKIPTPAEIGLSQAMQEMANVPRGLVLVTGPTGSGKTTTLACIIEQINQTQAKHILTVEDPIEFSYSNKMSVVDQREVGVHTDTFKTALKYSLRQNPDVILIGEMRDAETIAMAMSAAETGHLCFSTLHTNDAPSTIDRIIDEFPHELQNKIRAQLATVLVGVISQVLIPKKGGTGRVCAREFMAMNSGIASQIREGKIHQLYGCIESGGDQGMISLDQALVQLLKQDLITIEDALKKAHDPDSLKKLYKMHGGGAASAETMADPLAMHAMNELNAKLVTR